MLLLDTPRLRAALPNGATVLVERVPRAKVVSVSLWASARNGAERPATNGLRHLLEHLMAPGPKRDVDRRLESVGGYLVAQTGRETMNFRATVPTNRLAVAIDAIRDVISTPNLSPEIVQRERTIIAEEAALQEFPARLSAEAWTRFGRPDPVGDPVVMSNESGKLLDVYHRQFSASNLVLSIAGDVDLDKTMLAARGFMSVMPNRDLPEDPTPWLETKGALSGGLFAEVGPFDASGTAFTLAAALAMASEIDGGLTLYTPSATRSLVIIGSKLEPEALWKLPSDKDIDRLFPRGQSLVRNWVSTRLNGPESIADFRGMLACLRRDLRPETFLVAIDKMTEADFVAACRRFVPPTVTGGNR